jgi:hypothetical protein
MAATRSLRAYRWTRGPASPLQRNSPNSEQECSIGHSDYARFVGRPPQLAGTFSDVRRDLSKSPLRRPFGETCRGSAARLAPAVLTMGAAAASVDRPSASQAAISLRCASCWFGLEPVTPEAVAFRHEPKAPSSTRRNARRATAPWARAVPMPS